MSNRTISLWSSLFDPQEVFPATLSYTVWEKLAEETSFDKEGNLRIRLRLRRGEAPVVRADRATNQVLVYVGPTLRGRFHIPDTHDASTTRAIAKGLLLTIMIAKAPQDDVEHPVDVEVR